ncbi:MAG: DUF1249 domain-containing protein [Proteobacteria bacterium]|nr:DUF1249 domain-containing protein [Pseudomonadota bacterium]
MLITRTKKIRKIQSNYTNQACVSIQHEDNYQMLCLLLPSKLAENQQYKSALKGKPTLVIKVLNKYKYTIELEFCYQFKFATSEKIILKMYHDAQVAELVYCTNVQKFIRLLGPKIAPEVHKQTRNTLNTFLNKWLNFLLQNHYSSHQFKIQNEMI